MSARNRNMPVVGGLLSVDDNSHRTCQEENSVLFKGYLYATLTFNPPSHQQSIDQKGSLPLPGGWDLAPEDSEVVGEVVAKNYFGTDVVHFSNGRGFRTAKWGIEAGTFNNCYELRSGEGPLGSMYKAPCAKRAILIRRETRKAYPSVYQESLLHDLSESRRYPDCMLVCAGEEVASHRAVLAHASPVFDRMFSSGMLEATKQIVTIEEAEPRIVKALVHFAYTGDFGCIGASAFETDDLLMLLTLADRYQMDELVQICARKSLAEIDSGNVVHVARCLKCLSKLPSKKSLFDDLLEIIKNDDDIMRAVVDSL